MNLHNVTCRTCIDLFQNVLHVDVLLTSQFICVQSHGLWGVSGVALFITTDEQLQ